MNWSRVKTVLIILFLCTDIFLLATYLNSKYSASSIPSDVIESTVDVLKNNGIAVEPSVIPQKMPRVMHIEAENVISDYDTFAKSVLGDNFVKTEYGYESSDGKLTFFGDRFRFLKNQESKSGEASITDEKTAKEASASMLESLGFDLKNAKSTVSKTSDAFSVTFENYSGGFPVFNSQVTVTLSQNRIYEIVGTWFNETLSQNANGSVKSITSALVDFIPKASGDTRIVNLSVGYSILEQASYHKSATLIPVWQVLCDDESSYLLDARDM